MHEIISKKELCENVVRLDVKAPVIAAKRKAGQFVIVRKNEQGERIPLTIAGSDPQKGTITLIIQGVGKSTKEINAMNPGDALRDVAGPLGSPTHIENYGHCVVIGGGIGTAVALPVAQELKKQGNSITTILGARTKSLIILEKELEAVSDKLQICTDDGSYGGKGLVTDLLKKKIDDGVSIQFVLAIGPLPMMRAVAETTRKSAIKTMVSLNPIMIDGTGMCGGCRVKVDGQIKFACVDGPEFDGHLVDFDELGRRLRSYKEHEQKALHEYECRLNKELKK